MANKNINGLTAATTPLAGTELIPLWDGAATKKVSVVNLTSGRAVDTAGGTFTDNQTQGTAGKGINYTANTPTAGSTSQLLNWYEEGTWTPAPNVGTFSSANGLYTRIGRVVNLSFDIVVGIGGGSTVAAPVVSAVTTAAGIYTSGQAYVAGTTAPTVVIGGTGNTLYFRTIGAGVAFSAMTFTASASITGSITYTV